MKRSTDRILTTHVGRLPSPPDVLETVRAIQRGEPHDREAFGRRVRAVTAEVVHQQGETGVDIVSDGEIGRISPFWGRLAGYGPRVRGWRASSCGGGEPCTGESSRGWAEVHKDGRTDFLRRGEDYETEYRAHPHHPRREFGTSARPAGGVASQGSRPTLRS
jgi:hypothetical protein